MLLNVEADQGENDVPEWESSTEDQDSKEESGLENDVTKVERFRRSQTFSIKRRYLRGG